MRTRMAPSGSTRWIVTVSMQAIALLFVFQSAALAQPSVTLSIGGALNALAASAAPEDSRRTMAGSLSAEHQLAGQRLGLFYELEGGTFSTEGDWRYLAHAGGAVYRIPFGPPDEEDGDARPHAVFLTASGFWRTNGESWAAADYRGGSFGVNAEWRPRQTATFRTGYRIDVRRFPEYAELDQTEHDVFTSLLLNLPSRTTIIGEAHVGAKSYRGGEVWSVAGDPAVTGHEPRGGGLGRGIRWVSLGVPAGDSPTVARGGGSRATQVTWLARLAQSLADRTGASLQVSGRSGGGTLPPALVATPALFFDDGVYDDPFASQALELRGGLRHIFPNGMKLDGAATWTTKDYRGTTALDIEGFELSSGALRSDRIWRTEAAWAIPVLSGKGPVGVEIEVAYLYTRHRSNDAFYNYRSHALVVGASASY